jgi:alpha-mannosidase
VQRARVVRGIPAVYVDVQLEPVRMPDGDIWRSYFASRLAWSDDAVAVRRGLNWMSRETGRERIESPEWVEIIDPFGTITCYAFGLPFHRRASSSWLDTLLIVEGEERRRFQFAIALDENYPLRKAMGLMTAGRTSIMTLPTEPGISRGWFLHLGAKNIVATHVERLLSTANDATGIRVRLLETEGRDTQTTLAAFRPFTAARTTDFRGNSTGVLSMLDGRAQFDIAAHQWIQIEAEW